MNGITRIVVGVDHSQASESALRWALASAAQRGAIVRVVHVCELSHSPVRSEDDFESRLEYQVRASGQRLLDESLEFAKKNHPGVDVSTHLAVGVARHLLLEESANADTIVVGNRGTGGFAGLLLGSTPLHLASRAHCAVVAVPAASIDRTPGRGVVVGIDDPENAGLALEFGFREARELREPLIALHAWQLPAVAAAGPVAPLADDVQLAEGELRLWLEESLRPWTTRYPDVGLKRIVTLGHPAEALTEEARHARLLVVGAHSRGDVQSLILGSVSQAVLYHARHARCPVAIVRPRR
jgi:nucleotide-binding universal stress UspA family protein